MDAKIFKDIIGKSEILRLEAKRAFTILLAIGVPFLCVGLGVTIFSLFHFGEDDGPYNILLFIFLFVTLIGFILVIVAVSKKNKYQKNVLALIEASVDKELYTNVKKNRSAGFPLKMLLEPGFFASLTDITLRIICRPLMGISVSKGRISICKDGKRRGILKAMCKSIMFPMPREGCSILPSKGNSIKG